ncbi:MAG: MFS transporter, partial [Taibaiella sp.]|nr:MFS transporter [Taibaiella sp.]
MSNGTYSNTRLIFLIVISQFACTSLWFAGNAVAGDIIKEYHLDLRILSHIVTAVQLGFISGTLLFSILTISDRFSPSKVFFISALAGALANLLVFAAGGATGILISRYLTGFCLAGIYPVGMKIAADYHEKGLGKTLGFLVGALVLGTAFPHLLKTIGASVSWRYVMVSTSAMAAGGGLLVLVFVPDGPHRVKAGKPDLSLFFKLFRNKDFRSASIGYFGHMWELYTFWAFVPVILTTYNTLHPEDAFHVPLYSFL